MIFESESTFVIVICLLRKNFVSYPMGLKLELMGNFWEIRILFHFNQILSRKILIMSHYFPAFAVHIRHTQKL